MTRFSFKRILKSIFYYFGLDVRIVEQRYSYLQRMFNKIASVEGDIVECGIGKAYSFQILVSLLRNEGSARKLWGFDSFEGCPEPSEEDRSPRNPQKGEWKFINAEDVAKLLLLLGFKKQWIDSHVKIVKGFFKDTLPNNDIPQITLLHLDVDLYNSYKDCLRYLFPKVIQGGIVLFDEYMNSTENFKFPGAKKAIDEYFNGTKYKVSRDRLSGKYFLVKS